MYAKTLTKKLLKYTVRMHFRGLPLFYTKVPGEKLQAAVKDFWAELNGEDYIRALSSISAASSDRPS